MFAFNFFFIYCFPRDLDTNVYHGIRYVGGSARSPAPRRVRPAVGGVQCGEGRGAAPLGAWRLDGTGPGSDFLSL